MKRQWVRAAALALAMLACLGLLAACGGKANAQTVDCGGYVLELRIIPEKELAKTVGQSAVDNAVAEMAGSGMRPLFVQFLDGTAKDGAASKDPMKLIESGAVRFVIGGEEYQVTSAVYVAGNGLTYILEVPEDTPPDPAYSLVYKTE